MNNKRQQKRVWHRFVSILSCVVVFCTTYALILPAVTMERDDIVYYCGKEEHEHIDECYESQDEPQCGLEETEAVEGHTHTDDCYEVETVLTCDQDHEHTDECYEEQKKLVCQKEEKEAVEGHTHSEKCFWTTELVCGKEAHTHTRQCESNKDDKETKEEWEHSIPAKLEEKTADRVAQIAKSQKDYKEVKDNFEIDEDGAEHYYTRYGDWYGKPYEDWNVMFTSFVLKYAGIKNEQIPYGHDWNEWIKDLTEKKLFASEDFEPKNGDLIFIKDQKDENIPDKEIKNYVGIITDLEYKKVIVGDLNGQVKEITLDEKDYETNAYVEIKNETGEQQPPVEDDEPNSEEEEQKPVDQEEEQPKDDENKEEKEDKPVIDYQLPEQFDIETEDFTLVLKPRVFDDEKEEEQPKEEEKTNEPVEEDEEQGLHIKQYSLLEQENVQDKIDEENERTKEELDQIAQDNEKQQEEQREKPIPTVKLEKIEEQTTEEDQEEIEQLKEQMDEENLLDLSFYKLRFFVDDQEIDLGDQKFDAELTPTEDYLKRNAPRLDYSEAVEEIQKGTEIKIVQPNKTESDETAKTLLGEESADQLSAFFEVNKAPQTLMYTANANELTALAADEPGNNRFTVQYYGYLSEYVKAKDSEIKSSRLDINTYPNKIIPVIDMTTLPDSFQNANFEFYKLSQETKGSIKKELKSSPSRIYREREYQYFNAPNIYYFNRLVDQPSSKLSEVWVLEEGKSKESESKDDWKSYKADDVFFTNKQTLKDKTVKDSAGKLRHYIYLSEDGSTVIRLIYTQNTQEGLVSNANFYDYDITNGKKESSKFSDVYPTQSQPNSTGTTYGINSSENYNQNSGAPKLAFGNQNSGVYSLQDMVTSDGKNINKGYPVMPENLNMKTYLGKNNDNSQRNEPAAPVFRLVQSTLGKDEEGNPVLNYNGINAPDLFSSGTAVGKHVYENQNLSFRKVGNTYTLTSATVNGETLPNLDILKHPCNYNYIWTNSFWPMDGETIEKNSQIKDPQITGTNKYRFKDQQKDSYFPVSDDGGTHNNLFGMFFQIDFELDDDYLGPLEYFFFGDDDLWVYLDNDLIVDLGGVHRSYGAYVDIRQHLPVKENSTIDPETGESAKTKHTLTVYYTERGLSGSTCYMEFNLPSVTSVQQPPETGALRVYKETEDEDYVTPYKFRITLLGDAGMRDHVYKIYSQQPNSGGSGLVEHDFASFTSGATIELRNKEYVEITRLPDGTQYRIEEIDIAGNTKVYTGTVSSEYTEAKKEADGETVKIESGNSTNSRFGNIQKGNTQTVYFKNVRSYQLPETGSPGIDPPLIAGGASVMTTSFYVLALQRKGRWKKRKK
ncbi:fibro-slime domain-containing protein [uncultured Dubosiella sp.]|uniref:fibro-slime domain-containing protein n=2 Tax=uncultured Dubosiella sp. TaxID=1937011 RepID=UPI00272E838E|nr:fibro-slime domain-containing protein [uncultured Dubosiella sp.]